MKNTTHSNAVENTIQKNVELPPFCVAVEIPEGSGMEVLETFFTHMPSTSGLAFMIIQHLPLLTLELLSEITVMPVQLAEDKMVIRPNNVYIIPPKKVWKISQGNQLMLEQKKSLAEEHFELQNEKPDNTNILLEESNNQTLHNNERLERLVNILQSDVSHLQDFLDHALDELIQLTESKIGYIYYYNEDKKDFELNSWSKDVMKECGIAQPQTNYCLDNTGLWGEAVRQGKPIINNNFEAFHHHKKGYPEGHIMLKKFLTIPVFYNGKIVAVAGVANKVEDYDQTDVLQMTLLMNAVWKTTERIKSDLVIKASEEALREVGLLAKIGGWSLDLKTNKLFWTGETYRIHEVEPLFKPQLENAINFYAPEAQPVIKKAIEAAIKPGESFDLELPFITAKGNHLWVRSIGHAEKVNGEAVRLYGVFHDITERKNSENALRESEYFLRKAQEIAHLGSWSLDLINNKLTWSDENYRIFGLPINQFGATYEAFLEAIHPEDLEMVNMAYTNSIQEGKDGYEIEHRVIRKDNAQVRFVHEKCQHIKDATGKIIGSLGMTHDITDRKLEDQKVREKDLQFRKLSSNVPGLIYQFTRRPDGTYCVPIASDGIKNIFGCSPEDVIDDFAPISRVIYPEDSEKVIKDIEYSAEHLTSFSSEFRVKIPGKPIQWIFSRSTPEPLADGSVTWYGFDTDITERKQAEDELILKTEELQNLNAEKDKFFSIIAHDLRSPFNSFLGLTHIMAEELPNLKMSDIQEIAVSMSKSATNLYRLLENLLQWAQIQKGAIAFNPHEIDLQMIVNESIEMIIESARKKNIEIATHIPIGLSVFADSNMLQTIIRNFISNAVKFTPNRGTIHLSAKIGNHEMVEICIKDSGIGMPQSMVNQLFRLDTKTTRAGTDSEPSTGLGLVLCKEFIEKHGGKIWVKSEVEKGSEFHFTIPSMSLNQEEQAVIQT